MESRVLNIKYVTCSFDELEKSDAELVEAAKKATFSSYAPYSNFSVGARYVCLTTKLCKVAIKKMLLSVQELVPNDVQCFMLIQNIRIMLFVL